MGFDSDGAARIDRSVPGVTLPPKGVRRGHGGPSIGSLVH